MTTECEDSSVPHSHLGCSPFSKIGFNVASLGSRGSARTHDRMACRCFRTSPDSTTGLTPTTSNSPPTAGCTAASTTAIAIRTAAIAASSPTSTGCQFSPVSQLLRHGLCVDVVCVAWLGVAWRGVAWGAPGHAAAVLERRGVRRHGRRPDLLPSVRDAEARPCR